MPHVDICCIFTHSYSFTRILAHLLSREPYLLNPNTHTLLHLSHPSIHPQVLPQCDDVLSGTSEACVWVTHMIATRMCSQYNTLLGGGRNQGQGNRGRGAGGRGNRGGGNNYQRDSYQGLGMKQLHSMKF